MTTTDRQTESTRDRGWYETDNLSLTHSSTMDLSGVWAPCLTPLAQDLSIDSARLNAHVHWLLLNGCQGIVLFGTTGESASFSASERMSALETLIDSGVSPSNIIVGNGFTAMSDIVEVSQHAVTQGCRAVLMIPPFYFKDPSLAGLVAAYRYAMDAIDCPDLKVLLYHFPRMSTVSISHELIEALIDSHGEMIAGLKDSTGSWDSVQAYIQRFPNLSIFPGTDTLLLKGLKSGAAGTITATADINPHGISRVCELWKSGDDAQSAQNVADKIRMIISRYPLAAALKAVHANLCAEPGWNRLRPPLMPLDTEEQSDLMESLKAVGFEFPNLP